jgi:hypothetical protein
MLIIKGCVHVFLIFVLLTLFSLTTIFSAALSFEDFPVLSSFNNSLQQS